CRVWYSFFFFSSRRRHTRFSRDWSSDVCSSDLAKRGDRIMPARADMDPLELRDYLGWIVIVDVLDGGSDFYYRLVGTKVAHYFEIGRASCRESVWISEVGV